MTINGSTISRRRALSGAATAGLGLPLLAACGNDGEGSTAADPTSSTQRSEATPTTPKPEKTSSSPTEEPAGEGIATADVPVGGGIIVSEEQAVITQPKKGEFMAFTAVCTHAQCLVTSVSDGTINCPCHGSQYSIEDGSVTGGPAPAALATVDVTVDGDRIVLG